MTSSLCLMVPRKWARSCAGNMRSGGQAGTPRARRTGESGGTTMRVVIMRSGQEVAEVGEAAAGAAAAGAVGVAGSRAGVGMRSNATRGYDELFLTLLLAASVWVWQ